MVAAVTNVLPFCVQIGLLARAIPRSTLLPRGTKCTLFVATQQYQRIGGGGAAGAVLIGGGAALVRRHVANPLLGTNTLGW